MMMSFVFCFICLCSALCFFAVMLACHVYFHHFQAADEEDDAECVVMRENGIDAEEALP